MGLRKKIKKIGRKLGIGGGRIHGLRDDARGEAARRLVQTPESRGAGAGTVQFTKEEWQ